MLGGSFTTKSVSGVAFDLTGFGSFSSIAAGNVLDQTVSYDRLGGPFGLYEEIITLTPTSYDVALGGLNSGPDHADC